MVGLLTAMVVLVAVGAIGVQAQAGPWDAALHYISPSLVQQYNAVCLDGTNPGRYGGVHAS